MEETKLLRFFGGGCSPKEEREVLQWLKHPRSRKHFDRLLAKYFENPKPQSEDHTDYSELLNSIHQRVLMNDKNPNMGFRKAVFRSLRVAAGISVLLMSAFLLMEGIRYKEQMPLTEAHSNSITTTRVTGPGEKLTLVMPDQTKIIVNARSEISFTNSYGKEERLIRLKGEAYFDITPDPDRPFRVKSNGITTTALGTAFNVYAREKQFKIALTEGKVTVAAVGETVDLIPGQMATSGLQNNLHAGLSIQNFDQYKITAWKEDKLVFDRTPLGEILNNLAAWYSVEMRIGEGVDKDKRLIGTYENKNLKDILTGLSFSSGFDFSIQGKTVYIKT